MDFNFSEEERMVQQLTRRFVQEELYPLEKEYLHEDQLPIPVEKELERKARAIGLWALNTPKEHGGAGISTPGLCLVSEEKYHALLGDYRKSWGIGGDPSPIMYEMSEEQKQRWFYPEVRGEKHGGFCQSEPNAGSDPASMETTAVRDGDEWVLNGVKLWISSAQRADFFQVLAVTDKEKRGRGGITCFIVEKGTPGFRVSRMVPMMGGEEVGELTFEDCRVPDFNRVGNVGYGFVLGQKLLAKGRLMHGPGAVGIADRCLDMGIKHAKVRVTFGQPIANRQAIQWMLADSAVEIHATRLMSWHCAWKYDQGQDIRQEASMVKVFSGEMSGRVVDRVVQIHGAYGLSKDLPLEKTYRVVRHRRVGEGTVEIHRFVIARNLLRD